MDCPAWITYLIIDRMPTNGSSRVSLESGSIVFHYKIDHVQSTGFNNIIVVLNAASHE